MIDLPVPVDMAPGEVLAVNVAATSEPFTGWITNAEVGSGEGGAEGSEAGGEGSGEGESGEHGSGGERGAG